MSNLLRRLNRPLTSDRFDVQFGRIGIWLTAVLVLIMGFYKLLALKLAEKEFFFGVLLVLAVSLLMVLIGLVLPIADVKRPSAQKV